MKREYVNLTPHPIVVFKEDGSVVEIPPSGMVLRLEEVDEVIGEVDGIPLIRRRFRLSEEQIQQVFRSKDAVYIVSLPLLMSLPSSLKAQFTIISPDTGRGGVRDENGRIVGTKNYIIVET